MLNMGAVLMLLFFPLVSLMFFSFVLVSASFTVDDNEDEEAETS